MEYYSKDAPILREMIGKILEWIKHTNLIIHGGYAIDIQLKNLYNKGIYTDSYYASIDGYLSEEDVKIISDDFKKTFTDSTITHYENMRTLYLKIKGATIIQIQLYPKEIFSTIEFDIVYGNKVLPLQKSVAIYWALVNGYSLSIYNSRLDQDFSRLMEIANIIGDKLPAPYDIAESFNVKLESRINLNILPDCYYTGKYALSLYMNKLPKDDIPLDIACFGDPSSIVDILVNTYGYTHGEWYVSPNWGLIPGYYVMHDAVPEIRVFDCSTYTTGITKKIKSVSLLGLAAFHPGDISMNVLSTLYNSAGKYDRYFIGDESVGKGLADAVLRDLLATSGQDRYSFTTNIEFVKEALETIMASPVKRR
mgnify:CR=1 FL=1